MQQYSIDVGLGGGSLLQIAGRSIVQMMSYIITTPNGRLIVIDGGNNREEDGEHLYRKIKEVGGHVDLWYITHAHSDHFGALLWMLENKEEWDVSIGKLCYCFPPLAWLEEREPREPVRRFLQQVDAHDLPVHTLQTGDEQVCDGIRVSTLHHPEEYRAYSSINPTSVILRVAFPKRDVLFLADFDKHGEEEFLRLRDPLGLRCDIVQMAHHGQRGVTRSFYELVAPRLCLYTAPQWLWENNFYYCNDPETAGQGSLTIMETRRWMEELGVEHSLPYADGDYLLV